MEIRYESDRAGRDFVFDNDWDVCIPVSYTQLGETLIVSAFPEVLPALRRQLNRPDAGDPFARSALTEMWRLLAPYLAEWGYRDDRFRAGWGHILRIDPETPCPRPKNTDSRPLTAEDESHNRTTYDFAATAACGRLMYGIERDGGIVSCAVSHCAPGECGPVVEVGVETIPAARGQGMATANLRALSAELLSRGYTVEYRCRHSNRASLSVARAAGFLPVGRFYHYVTRRVPDADRAK